MKRTHKKVLYIVGGVFVVSLVTTIVVTVSKNTQETQAVVYRETTVEYGELTVGISEDSTVNIGTMDQTFDLDISAFVDTGSSSSTASGGNSQSGFGFGNGAGGMSFSFGSSTMTSQEQQIDIDEVHISVGQSVQQGDVLYTLSEEDVNAIRVQLEEDVADTLDEYESIQVDQIETRTSVKQNYDTYVINGKLAQLTYDMSVADLEDAVTQAEEEVNEKQNQYNENGLTLLSLTEELAVAKANLNEATAAVEANYEGRYENAYYYYTFLNSQKTAQKLVDNLEEEIEQLTEENLSLTTQIQESLRAYNQACRSLESGKLEAQKTMDTDSYYASAASGWYSLQLQSLEREKTSAYNSYQSAVSKLESFNDYVVGNDVISEYDGIVTEVPLAAGDGISKNTVLVSMYDQDEITMEVQLTEDDFASINQDGMVNIYCDAYPDEQFEGIISEISDAEYNSNTATVYYTLTVTIQGNVTGLYEGMSGEVTFVTRQTQEVTYVSNRAIFREGTKSYVKVKKEDGTMEEKEVVTGFSDGINVEIVEGLSEGDIVLIESKVSES